MRLGSHDTYSFALIGKALLAPLRHWRDDVHTGGWISATFGAAWSFVTGDIFTGILAIAMLSGAWDYFAGVRLAKHRGTYNSALAHAGWMGKISGIALVLLVRILEAWAVRFVRFDGHGWSFDTYGSVSAALGLGLVIAELRSIAHNRSEWGAPPIPVLNQLLAFFDSLAASWIPARRPTAEEIAAREAREREVRIPTPPVPRGGI
jgi:hypothetical protein